MDIPGFTLLLQEFCEYCPDFDCQVETFGTSSFEEPVKSHHNIRCRNAKRCARIAQNLSKRVKE